MTIKLSEAEKARRRMERNAQKDQSSTIRGDRSGGSDTGSGGGSEGENGGLETNNNGSTGSSDLQSGSDIGKGGAGNPGDRGDTGTSGGGSGGLDTGVSGTGTDQAGSVDNTKGQKKLVDLKPRILKPTQKGSTKKSDTKKKADLTDSETLTTLIVDMSCNYAKVTRKSYWAIPEDEAQTIADPASIVLQSIPKKQIERINKFIAPIALITAAITVVAPRVMMDIAVENEKRRIANVNKSTSQSSSAGITQADTGRSNIPVGGKSSKDTRDQNSGVHASAEVTALFESMDNGAGTGEVAK